MTSATQGGIATDEILLAPTPLEGESYGSDPPAEIAAIGWVLPALWLVFAGGNAWAGVFVAGWAWGVAVLAELVGLAVIVVALTRRRVPRHLQVLVLAVAGATVAARAFVAVVGTPSYGTDEMAFDQYAAHLVLSGVNPYLHSMAPALARYQVPDIFRTWLLGGGAVTRLSYPAGSFLFYLPALAAGMHMQAATVTDIGAWVISGFVAWGLLPAQWRWTAPLLMLGGTYFGYSVGGVTGVLYLPFLAVAIARWDRFSEPGRGRLHRWAGPVCLGIACTVKQTPWFVVPFLVAGVYLEAARWAPERRGREVGAYLVAAASAFVALDLPWMVQAPGAFLRALGTPLFSPTVPGGEGLVGATMFMHLGGSLVWYTALGAAAALVGFCAYLSGYPESKRAIIPIVALIFFWPTRSFESYLIEMMPLALIGALTVRCDPVATKPKWLRLARAATGGFLALGGLALAGALVAGPPIQVKVVGKHSTGQMQSIDFLHVAVRNTSSRTITPHYSVIETGYDTAFWSVVKGPERLRPHQAARVEIEAPNTDSMPSTTSGFEVVAFTANPKAMAVSDVIRTSHLSTVLSPSSVGATTPVGEAIRVAVRLTNRVGNTVHKAGVPVTLGQVVYGQNAIVPGSARINGAPEGHSPVVALTNSEGVANFAVVGAQPLSQPVSFQAWVQVPGSSPVAYSNILSTRFVAAGQARPSSAKAP